MAEDEEQKIDWIYLPPEVEEVSLWGCLHDGELISCRSDLLRRFVGLEFKVSHLLSDAEEGVSFTIRVEAATSVRAIGHFRSIDKYEEPRDISPEERTQLTKEYWTKWREESLSWSEFESALATDPLQITDAAFVSSDCEKTLKLGGFLNGEKFDDIYFDVFVRGRGIDASRSDGNDFNLDAFIELGRNYWDDL